MGRESGQEPRVKIDMFRYIIEDLIAMISLAGIIFGSMLLLIIFL